MIRWNPIGGSAYQIVALLVGYGGKITVIQMIGGTLPDCKRKIQFQKYNHGSKISDWWSDCTIMVFGSLFRCHEDYVGFRWVLIAL